jgi:hypothetical protein
MNVQRIIGVLVEEKDVERKVPIPEHKLPFIFDGADPLGRLRSLPAFCLLDDFFSARNLQGDRRTTTTNGGSV